MIKPAFLFGLLSMAQASSTIYDGVIEKITETKARKAERQEDGRLKHHSVTVTVQARSLKGFPFPENRPSSVILMQSLYGWGFRKRRTRSSELIRW